MNRYSKSNFKTYDGSIQYGRIIKYNRAKGYGFLRTQDGKDLFLSSYYFVYKKDEKHGVPIGAIVSYRIVFCNHRYCASNVRVIEKYPNGAYLSLPGGITLPLLDIACFYYSEEQECVCVQTKSKEEIMVVSGDNSQNETAKEYYEKLVQTYLQMPENFERQKETETDAAFV